MTNVADMLNKTNISTTPKKTEKEVTKYSTTIHINTLSMESSLNVACEKQV